MKFKVGDYVSGFILFGDGNRTNGIVVATDAGISRDAIIVYSEDYGEVVMLEETVKKSEEVFTMLNRHCTEIVFIRKSPRVINISNTIRCRVLFKCENVISSIDPGGGPFLEVGDDLGSIYLPFSGEIVRIDANEDGSFDLTLGD